MLSLRRITSSGRFVPEIDGLRFAAIAPVVLYHLHGFAAAQLGAGEDAIAPLLRHGYRGVNLFYVISGFILGLPFAVRAMEGKPAPGLKPYFLRRLTRLEPPYVLNLLICFALLVLVDGASTGALLPHLGASLLYLHSLGFGSQSTINPVAWTLEVEVQFYCLAPLLAAIFRLPSKTARRALLAGAMLVAGVAQTMCWDAALIYKLTILFAIQFFLAGLLLADLYAADWNQNPSSNWRWDLLSLGCWPVLFLLEDLRVWVALPFLLFAACLAAFRGSVFRRIFRNRALTTIGGMCYTIYLFHYTLILYLFPHTKPIGAGGGAYFAVQLALYLPALAALSVAYYALIERPCMAKDWPRRLWLAINRG